MEFNSYSYLIFLGIAAFLFWQLKGTWRGPYLLVVSLVFYATWNPYFLLLPLSFGLLVYFLARLILARPDSKKRWKNLGIVLVVLTLGFFKYLMFFLNSFNAITANLGLPALTPNWAIGIPLGLSFYSFECISFLIDTSQGRTGKTKLLDLFDFICFWPHLMAGPIVRVRELIPQFKFQKKFEVRFVTAGLDRFIWGLVQKNMFANTMAGWVDQGFQQGRTISTLDGWFLAAAFGLQIYFDFAGYTNMAIGAAQLMGIKLPENFHFPYHAISPPDFWSRWHMTLTRWIRDYMFFPVSARYRNSPLSLYASLIGVMAIVGLWHGAGWGFVIWGILHGLYMVSYRIYQTFNERRGGSNAAAGFWRIFWPSFTLVAVTAAWVSFRASDLAQAVSFWKSMFISFSFRPGFAPHFYETTILVSLFCIIEPFLVPFLDKMEAWAAGGKGFRTGIAIAARALVYCGGLLLFIVFSHRDVQFIYFQF